MDGLDTLFSAAQEAEEGAGQCRRNPRRFSLDKQGI